MKKATNLAIDGFSFLAEWTGHSAKRQKTQ
jgi:hypothetical protein